MTWQTIMVNPRRCCMCRRRAWFSRSRYLGMRCHSRCRRAKLAEMDRDAPFRWVRAEQWAAMGPLIDRTTGKAK